MLLDERKIDGGLGALENVTAWDQYLLNAKLSLRAMANDPAGLALLAPSIRRSYGSEFRASIIGRVDGDAGRDLLERAGGWNEGLERHPRRAGQGPAVVIVPVMATSMAVCG